MTLGLSLLLLASAGCTDAGQPSPPPDPVDSISDPSATSQPPPPDTETETATATETAKATASPTTEAGGPPELPPEATEQTEAGAEAFAIYFLKHFDYLRQNPVLGGLHGLYSESCTACLSYEGQIDDFATNSLRYDAPSVEIISSQTVGLGEEFLSTVTVNELAVDTIDRNGEVVKKNPSSSKVGTVFTLTFNDEDGWIIDVIQLAE